MMNYLVQFHCLYRFVNIAYCFRLNFLAAFLSYWSLFLTSYIQTAEQEKAMRELVLKDRDQGLGVCGLGKAEKTDSSSRKVRTILVSHLFHVDSWAFQCPWQLISPIWWKLPAVVYISVSLHLTRDTVFSLSLETHQSKRDLKMCEHDHPKVTCLIYNVLVIIPKTINMFYLLMRYFSLFNYNVQFTLIIKRVYYKLYYWYNCLFGSHPSSGHSSGVVFLPKSLMKQLGLRLNFLVTFHFALTLNLSYKVVQTQVWVQNPF